MHRRDLFFLGTLLLASCDRQVAPVAHGVPVPLPSEHASHRLETVVDRPWATSSSSLVLARFQGRTLLLLADEDDRVLRAIDADGNTVATIAVDGVPGHVTVAHGRAYVTIRDAAHVQTFDLACADRCSFMPAERIDTPPEPVALAVTPDAGTLLVSCGWGRSLLAHPLTANGKSFVTPLAREPRGLVVDDAGATAVVTHGLGSLVTTVSLADGAVAAERDLSWRDDVIDPPSGMIAANVPRFTAQGFAVAAVDDRTLLPMVLVYPGDPLTEASGYGLSVGEIQAYLPHEEVIVAFDATSGGAVLRTRRHVVDADSARMSAGHFVYPPSRPPCLLPRAVATDPLAGTLLVACMDLGAVVEIDAEEQPLAAAEHRRWQVGAGVTAVAVDSDARTAWAWSAFDRRLVSLPLDTDDEITVVDVPSASPPAEAEGRRAFHAPRASDGRSCASCHVDGRDDAIVWNSPVGLVQTPMLAGRTPDTAPFGWRGESHTIEEHLFLTMKRLKAEKPSDATLAALARWVATMPTYRQAHAELGPDEERGRDLFHAPEVGCAYCHARDGTFTDGSLREVGTGAPFDTPSLRFVADTAPYMHDGRYDSLRQVFAGTHGKMGYTAQLADPDMSALLAYLRTL
jgi:DNA-binding beta-propeller fold protein YncE/mono/diheme cytochrome c family protein